MFAQPSDNKSHVVLVMIVAVLVIAAALVSPPGRRLVGRFFSSLRVQKVQTVNINLSSFVGANANRTLQQMMSQMVSDKVTITVRDKGQDPATPAEASHMVGFPILLLQSEKTAPHLAVSGKHAFTLQIDRRRLQAILKEAGRSELVLPAGIDGANVDVTIPPIARARYGDCPGPPRATANIATPPPSTTAYASCVLLAEGRSPQVNAPADADLPQLAEIGLEVAGMTRSQAQEFLHEVNWKSTLGFPIPRFMRSYQSVKVDGVNGTLFSMAGRRGPTYSLIWAKSAIVYSLTGFGNSADAVTLANSLTQATAD